MEETRIINNNFLLAKNNASDINEHIQTLADYAAMSSTVLECGVRSGNSTWGMVFGLMNNNSEVKKLVSCDLNRDPSFEFRTPLVNKVLDFKFWIGNDLDYPDDENFDLIFIDTWHIYGHLKRELAKFAPMCNKYIIMHDTDSGTDGVHGESVRCGFNVVQQSKDSGYSLEEITKGLQPAISEFLESHPEFKLLKEYTNCNGLTILERVSEERVRTDYRMKSNKIIDSEKIIVTNSSDNNFVGSNNFNKGLARGCDKIKSSIPVKIGSYTMIYGKCYITYAKHDDEKFTSYIFDDSKCEIGCDVIIYPNVKIFGGVNIGHGSRLLEGAVIAEDIKPYSIIDNLGNVTSRYDDDTIKSLLELEWWNLSDDVILKNKDLLSSKSSSQSIIDELKLLKK